MPECDPISTPADALFRLGIVLCVVVPWLWFIAIQILPWRRRGPRKPVAPSLYWRAVLWCLSWRRSRR